MTVRSKTVSVLAVFTLGSAALAACAPGISGPGTSERAAAQAPDLCFKSGDIINVNVIDKQTLYVATKRGYVYKLDAPGGCYVQGASISVSGFSGGPNTGTCVGNQARVAVGGAFRGPSFQCIAQITGPYTDSHQTGLWSRPTAP